MVYPSMQVLQSSTTISSHLKVMDHLHTELKLTHVLEAAAQLNLSITIIHSLHASSRIQSVLPPKLQTAHQTLNATQTSLSTQLPISQQPKESCHTSVLQRTDTWSSVHTSLPVLSGNHAMLTPVTELPSMDNTSTPQHSSSHTLLHAGDPQLSHQDTVLHAQATLRPVTLEASSWLWAQCLCSLSLFFTHCSEQNDLTLINPYYKCLVKLTKFIFNIY